MLWSLTISQTNIYVEFLIMIKNDISVTRALQQSFDWVKYVLFHNFDIGKWFVMGFCAWISLLGESGGLNSANFRRSGNRGSYNSNSLHNIWNFILEHLFIIIGITILAVIIIIAVSLVIQWLSSRGKFMFLDCTVKNNAAVKEPWSQFKRLANSLFIFRVLFGFISLVLILIVSFISLVIAWPDITGKIFSANAITSIIVGGSLFFILILEISIINNIIFDFIVPIMYKKNIAIIEAIHVFRNDLLSENVKHFVLFYLMKIAVYIAIAILVLAAYCLTCCIACCLFSIPYIGVVILLPVIMFKRCYSIFFLEQFGDEWKLIVEQSDINS
jgi:hypothetical protein